MAAVLPALMQKDISENYISPFFHLQADEDTAQITARLQALKDIGIHAVTVEYKANTVGFDMRLVPFDGAFMAVMDRLVAACRQLNMSFWLQDAAPFPTGQVNGRLEDTEYAHLNKLYLDERHLDVAGPRPGAVLHAADWMLLRSMANMAGGSPQNLSGQKQLCTVAYRRDENGTFDEDSAVLLDEYIQDGLLYWDVPEGHWRIFVIFTTYGGGGRTGFMNLLSRESVQLEIEAVHRPIYEKLKEELGKTWSGFFYDEPELGNAIGFNFDLRPGRKAWLKYDAMVLPWSDEMPAMMAQRSASFKIFRFQQRQAPARRCAVLLYGQRYPPGAAKLQHAGKRVVQSAQGWLYWPCAGGREQPRAAGLRHGALFPRAARTRQGGHRPHQRAADARQRPVRKLVRRRGRRRRVLPLRPGQAGLLRRAYRPREKPPKRVRAAGPVRCNLRAASL